MGRSPSLLTLCFACLVVSMPAYAETPVEAEARAWYEKGKALYEEADYGSAFIAFRTSYRLAPRGALLFNIAQALRLSGRCGEALGYYERFREQTPDLPKGFDEAYDKAQKCVGAEIEPKSETSDGGARDVPAVATPPAPAPAMAAIEPPRERSNWNFGRTVGVSLLAVGGVTAAGAVIGVIESRDASERTASLSQRGGAWDDAARANEDTGRRWATWSVALGIASGVSVGTGLWLLLRSDGSRSAVTATATPSGATVSWSGIF